MRGSSRSDIRIGIRRCAGWRTSTPRPSRTCSSGSAIITCRTMRSSCTTAPSTSRQRVRRADPSSATVLPGPEVDAYKTWVPERLANTHDIQYDEVPAVLVNRAWVVPPRMTRDRALLDLAAAVLGQGRNSRLYIDLVYEQQVASQVNVGVTPFELASVFDLSVVLNPGEPAVTGSEAIDRIVADFIQNGPTADELERVVASVNASIVRGLERVGGFNGKAVTLAEGELYAGDPLFVQTYLEWINGATPAD